MQDAQWDFLGSGSRRRFGMLFLHQINASRNGFVAGPDGLAVEGHPACLDQGLDLGTGKFGKMAGEHRVETPPGILRCRGDLMGGRGSHSYG